MKLAPRELEYLRFRARGLTQQEVASAMKISFQTAKNYQSDISEKVLGRNGRLIETLYALGWVREPR